LIVDPFLIGPGTDMARFAKLLGLPPSGRLLARDNGSMRARSRDGASALSPAFYSLVRIETALLAK
jgi:hypothetical protein